MTTLSFDPESHSYKLDGRRLISVTQVLKSAGIIDTSWYTDWAAERGSAVHKAIQLESAGELDEDSVDFNVQPYLEAYRKFRLEKGWHPVATELMVVDRVYEYAGTLDALGMMKDRMTIVDYKTGPLAAPVGLQLSAYALGVKAYQGKAVTNLVGVQLKPDGTYKMKRYPFEPLVFRAALKVAQWKAERMS